MLISKSMSSDVNDFIRRDNKRCFVRDFCSQRQFYEWIQLNKSNTPLPKVTLGYNLERILECVNENKLYAPLKHS